MFSCVGVLVKSLPLEKTKCGEEMSNSHGLKISEESTRQLRKGQQLALTTGVTKGDCGVVVNQNLDKFGEVSASKAQFLTFDSKKFKAGGGSPRSAGIPVVLLATKRGQELAEIGPEFFSDYRKVGSNSAVVIFAAVNGLTYFSHYALISYYGLMLENVINSEAQMNVL